MWLSCQSTGPESKKVPSSSPRRGVRGGRWCHRSSGGGAALRGCGACGSGPPDRRDRIRPTPGGYPAPGERLLPPARALAATEETLAPSTAERNDTGPPRPRGPGTRRGPGHCAGAIPRKTPPPPPLNALLAHFRAPRNRASGRSGSAPRTQRPPRVMPDPFGGQACGAPRPLMYENGLDTAGGGGVPPPPDPPPPPPLPMVEADSQTFASAPSVPRGLKGTLGGGGGVPANPPPALQTPPPFPPLPPLLIHYCLRP